jgi:hypothetical protein
MYTMSCMVSYDRDAGSGAEGPSGSLSGASNASRFKVRPGSMETAIKGDRHPGRQLGSLPAPDESDEAALLLVDPLRTTYTQ